MNIKAISAFVFSLIISFVFSASAQIGSPVMDKPADKSTKISTSPLLQLKTIWSATAEFEVDTVSAFNSTANQKVFGLASKKEHGRPYFLHFNKKYFWRSRIMLSGDTSAWSSAWTFTTVSAPVLYAPADNSAKGTSVLLWYNAGGSDYKIELDTTPNFNSPFLQKFDYKDTVFNELLSISLKKLLFGKKHYWRVKAMHKNGTSNWSDTWSFTMPTNTTLRKPLNNAVLNGVETILEWNELQGAQFYHVQYDTTLGFNSKIRVDTIVQRKQSGWETLAVKNLSFNKEYYWHVSAITGNDTSEWSDTWNFTSLPVFKLSSPYNGATFIDVNEAVRASGLYPGNYMYEFQVDSTSDFNSPHLFSAYSSNAFIIPAKRLFNTKYFWRARAMHVKDTSEWSDIRTYTTRPPSKPSILSPNNNSLNQPLDITIQWDARGALKTIIQLDTTADFSAPVLIDTFYNDNNISFPSIKVKELNFNQKYHLRVRNYLDLDSTDWSYPNSFTTIARPELDFPYNNQTNFGTETNIVAKPIVGATHYLWELDTNANFNSPAIRSGVSTSTTVDPGGEFYFGKWYYWRFKAAHAKDTSEWSLVRRFESTATIFLFSPANNTYNVSNKPNFDWGGIAGATGYQYLLSQDSTFTNVKPVTVMGQANTKHIIPVSYGSFYYWKVRAFHTKDTSAWSARYMFKTKNEPVIPAPLLTTPKNNAVNVKAGTVQFFWSAGSVNATSYDFQLDYSNTFVNPVVSGGGLPNAFAQINGIKPSQGYYWRVRTHVDTLLSPWSTPYKFTTETISGMEENDISEINSKTVSVFPNPAKGKFTIKLHNDKIQLKCFSLNDANGKMWMQNNNFNSTYLPSGAEIYIDASSLPAGIYILSLQMNDKVENIRIVLQ